MKLYRIVAKDIVRRKKRVLYAALGVVIGTMTVVGILTIALAGQERITAQLEKYGPNLSVVPAISNLDMKLGDLSLGTLTVGENYISADKLPQMQQIADEEIRKGFASSGAKFQDDGGNIATLAPKLFVNTKVEGVSVMVVGIQPAEEVKIKTWWKMKEGENIQNPDQALVGSVAASLLQLKVGSPISINGTNLTVSGLIDETGANDDYQIFIPIDTLQKAFNKEGLVSSIDIRALCNACPVEVIADSLNKDIAGIRAVAVKQVAETEMGMLEKINRFMIAMAIITLAVGLFGVINTMMTSVHERIKDIGIMRAVGASRNQIIKIFIYEALVVGIIGGIFGYIFGTLLAYAIGPVLLEGTTVTYVPQYFPVALAIAIFVAIVATSYPAFRATRIRVADSFRSL
jgi:putative ABC transport system permease protein